MNQDPSKHYTKAYFEGGQAGSARSARRIVPQLIRFLSPKSVVDVGCGIGTWTHEFWLRGIEDVLGVDGPYIPKDVLLIDHRLFFPADLSEPLNLKRTFDLALTLEVAEHLSSHRARTFIADLVRLAPVVAFSGAIPGQGGANHINEQWPDYWEKLFAEHDYIPRDCLRQCLWDDPEIEFWYRQNLILFVKRDHLDEYPRLTAAPHIPQLLRLVHPEMHLRNVSMLKRLVPRRDG